MERIGDRSVFITQSLEDVRINIHHGRAMCEAANAHAEANGSVECWFESSAVAHNDRNESGVLSHVTLMLTQPEMYRNKMVNFFEEALATPEAVV